MGKGGREGVKKEVATSEEEEEEEEEVSRQIDDAGKSIGRWTAELAILLEKLSPTFSSSSSSLLSASPSLVPEDIGI